MTTKRERAMAEYNGHTGQATVAHVERNIKVAYPTAYQDLTGVQYGRIMSVANTSYHDGQANATANGEVWDYVSPTNFVAGIGPRQSDDRGGHNNAAMVEVSDDTVKVISNGITTLYRREVVNG